MYLRPAVAALLLLAAALPGRTGVAAAPLGAHAPASAKPDINAPYQHPVYQDWVRRFEHPGREVYDRRYEIVNAVGIRPGMTVADIGAGTGLFTRLFVPLVGARGLVYAVDISRGFVASIERMAREQGLNNVRGIVNTQTDVSLPASSVDIAFVCDTYHHFEHPRETLASLHRALRPDGLLVVIDYRRVAPASAPWVLQHVRAGKDKVIEEIEAAGFQLTDDLPFLKTNYFLRFRKR